MPSAESWSTSPSQSGASGPTTTRSTCSARASSRGLPAALRMTFPAEARCCPLPALPGATITSPIESDASRRSARACSRPPEPTTRTLCNLATVSAVVAFLPRRVERSRVAIWPAICGNATLVAILSAPDGFERRGRVAEGRQRLSNPVVIRVVRPYQNADDYIAAEAWSIETKTMLLVGARARPVGTPVRFDVALETGEKVIRAEGTVVRHVEP